MKVEYSLHESVTMKGTVYVIQSHVFKKDNPDDTQQFVALGSSPENAFAQFSNDIKNMIKAKMLVFHGIGYNVKVFTFGSTDELESKANNLTDDIKRSITNKGIIIKTDID